MPINYEQLLRDLKDLKTGDNPGCYYSDKEDYRTVVAGLSAVARQEGHRMIVVPGDPGEPGQEGSVSQSDSCRALPGDSGILFIREGQIPDRQDAFLSLLTREMENAIDDAWKGVRICLDVSRLPRQILDGGSLRAFISKLASPGSPCVSMVLCFYDRRNTPPEIILESLAIHPRVLIGGRLIDNSSFISREDDAQSLMPAAVGKYLDRLEFEEELTQELDDLKDKYRFVFENTSDFLFVHDMEGFIKEINLVDKEVEGYTEQRLLQLNIRDLTPQRLMGEIDDYMKRILEQGKAEGTIHLVGKSGVERIFEYKSFLMRDENGPTGARGLARDISDKISVEGRLQKSEERYRDIFNNVTDYLYFHDLDGNFDFEECNFTVRENWSGLKPDRGKTNLREIIPERFRFSFDDYLKRIMEAGSDEGPLCVVASDGLEHILEYKNTLVYDKDGTPVGVRGSARDITDRIRAENRLRKSEEKYRTILESIEEGYYEVDLKGCFVFCNDSLCRILGSSREDLIGSSYSTFVGEETARGIFKTFNMVFSTGKDVESAEWEFSRKSDGRKIYIDVSVSRILSKNNDCRGFRGIIRDVTNRVQAEMALIESEQRYRNIFNNVSDFLYFHDLNGDFDFEEVNERVKRAWVYRDGTKRRMSLKDLMPERHKPFFKEYIRRIREKEKDTGLLTVVFREDGKEHVLEYNNSLVYKNGVPVGVQGSARDVTDRINAERQLRKSEEKYRTVLESIEEGYYEVDLNGCFAFCNDAMCRITGYTTEELVGMSYREVSDEENAKRVFDAFNGVFRTGEDLRAAAWEFIRKGGQNINCEVSISRVMSRDGKCTGFRGIVRDVTKRVQAERALKESEEKYRTILETIEEGYYEVDMKGRFTFFNDSFCRILGSPREELLGLSYSDLVEQDTAEVIFNAFNTVFATGRDLETAEWEFNRKIDGAKIYIEVSVSRIMLKDGRCRGFRGIVRDVTNRVRVEKALMESEQRYRLLAENVNDIIWTADLNYNFTYVSPWVKQIARVSVEDTMKLNIRHVMSHEMFEKIDGDFRELMGRFSRGEHPEDTVRRYEFEHSRGDSTWFWADTIASIQFGSDGQPIGIVGVTRDITERKRSEEEIKKNEAKYRSILDGIEEGYYECDLSGRFTFFNDSQCRILGFTREELEGMNYRNYMDKDTSRKVYQTYNRVYETGKPETGFGWEFIRKDGKRIQVEASIQLMRESKGEPIGFRGVLRDISDRRQAEALRAAKLKAEAENRAKSEFLANMSHEIRTPLNGIIGMTEIALDTDLDENQKDIVHVINRESEILLNLINDILDFSKIEADRYELEEIPFDLRVLIEDLAHSFAMRSEKKGLEFISFLSHDAPARLLGDPGRLRQVIANLAGNALKFTEKGEIFIKVEMEEDLGNKVVLRFSVKDSGIGIPRDKQEKIFDSFTQADGSTTRKYGGTGLGLAISKRIVEMMHGVIGVESIEGEGSTFFFTATFARQKEQRAAMQPEDIDLKGLRVLIVDDNETNRFILMEYLKTWECLPVDTPGGIETITVLRAAVALNEPFDLILMDFHMPDMDGFELARRIREVNSLEKIPIIVLTSLGDIGDGKSCRDIGIQGYLPKPTRRDDLKKAIISVLDLAGAYEQEENQKLITRHTIAEDFRKDVQILLAEDYPTNQQVAMRHLYKAGYQVDVAENGQHAVAAFKRKRYDLILMDVQMPIMDGYEATRQIRQWEEKLDHEIPPGTAARKQRIPIIALTAHAIAGYRDRCIEAGMDDYLAKPLRREELTGMVDKWIKGKHLADKASDERQQAGEPMKCDMPMEKKQCPIDLDKAMSEFDADRDFLKEILGGFIKNVEKQIQVITKAISDGDAEIMRKEAHSIKGGAANICADELSHAAMEMENLGKTGKVDTGGTMLKRLEQEFLNLAEFYENELKG